MIDIHIITDKTLIIPEDAPPVLKLERIEANCCWHSIMQENELLMAEGEGEFKLAYLSAPIENYDKLSNDELIEALEKAACNPDIPKVNHCLCVKSVLEIMEQVQEGCNIHDLKIMDIAYTLISPHAVELQLELYACCDAPKDKCEDNCEDKCEDKCEDNCEDNCEEAEKYHQEDKQEDAETTEDNSVKAQEAPKKIMPRCNPRFSAPKTTAKPVCIPNSGSKSCYCMKFYRVREGENMWSIAEKLGIPAAEISMINNLGDGEVIAGMLLSIPKLS